MKWCNLLRRNLMPPFFALLVMSLVPAEGKFSRHFRLLLDYDACRKKVVKWHRSELEKLDHVFQLQQAAFKLALAREKARTEGSRPHDVDHPTLLDFVSLPGPTRK